MLRKSKKSAELFSMVWAPFEEHQTHALLTCQVPNLCPANLPVITTWRADAAV